MTLPVTTPTSPGWFHVKMETSFNGLGAALSFNGIPVSTTTQSLATEKIGIYLSIGPAAAATTGKARVAFDNVVLTLVP